MGGNQKATSADWEGGGIESATVVSDGSWDDRPPVSSAENDHIVVCAPPRSSSNAICRSACTGSIADLYPADADDTPVRALCPVYSGWGSVGIRPPVSELWPRDPRR